jgi:hypothetical protein
VGFQEEMKEAFRKHLEKESMRVGVRRFYIHRYSHTEVEAEDGPYVSYWDYRILEMKLKELSK